MIKIRISEVHAKLDRRCVIAIKQHSGIFELLARRNETVPAYSSDNIIRGR